MAVTGYEVDFTDRNINRSFQLRQYTTNGPEHPNTDALDASASAAASSLLLFGKGMPNYGERMAENVLHLLEHFASIEEPTYPIGGQVWYDKSEDPYQLRVYTPRKHRVFMDGDNLGDISYFAITLPDDKDGLPDATDLSARFTSGFRIRITQDTTGVQEEYLINTAGSPASSGVPAVNGAGLFAFQVTPTPPASRFTGDWYIGGWEYVLQNNTPLHGHLNAGDWRITNLRTPINPSDAATMDYVDDAVAQKDALSELTDTSIIAPLNGHLLEYDTGSWVNKAPSSLPFLLKAGGTMAGVLTLNATPAPNDNSLTAATTEYVDTAISAAGGGIPTTLDDLSDVVIPGVPATDSVLQFNGAVWANIDLATFITNSSILQLSGGNMSGALNLHASPIVSDPPLRAATKGYVDSEITAAVAGTADGVVDGGYFDSILQELTLTRTESLPDVVITGFATGGVTSDLVTHQIIDPRTVGSARGLFWETTAGANTQYPTVPLDDLMFELNRRLGGLVRPRQRVVLTHPASPTPIYDLDGAVGSPAGAFGDLAMSYVPVSSNLRVYINGVKQIASEHGWLEVAADFVGGSPPSDQLWEGFPTGLALSTLYDFEIRLNMGSGSDTGWLLVTIDGSAAQSLGQLRDALHFWADTNTNGFGGASSFDIPPFGVSMVDGVMFFYSAFPGTGSKVDLSDGNTFTGGSPINLPLFANLTGGTAGPYTFNFTISPGTLNAGKRNDGVGGNPPAPLTRAYREVGRYGRSSRVFEWESGSEPGVGETVEIIIDNELVFETNAQP